MLSARDPFTWAQPVTPAHGFCTAQLNLWSWEDWAAFQGFAKSVTFSKCQRSVVSARDVLHDFFCSRWAFRLINLVCLLPGWPFYNSKSSKPNRLASPFRRVNKRLLVIALELSIPPMQWLGLVLAGALIWIFLPPAKMRLLGLLPLKAMALPYQLLLWHVLLPPTLPSKWPKLMLAITLVKISHQSSVAMMTLLNKPQELGLIAMALMFSLLFPLGLIAFFASHSSRGLLRKLKELTEPQRALTNNQWLFCSYCWYFFCSTTCDPASAPLSTKEPF